MAIEQFAFKLNEHTAVISQFIDKAKEHLDPQMTYQQALQRAERRSLRLGTRCPSEVVKSWEYYGRIRHNLKALSRFYQLVHKLDEEYVIRRHVTISALR